VSIEEEICKNLC